MLCETKVVHREAKCASLEDRRKVHITNFVYRRLEKGIQHDERDIPTRRHDAPLFLVPFPHNESFKRSVQYSGAVTWNNLPVNTRMLNHYDVFKVHQKKTIVQKLFVKCYTQTQIIVYELNT